MEEHRIKSAREIAMEKMAGIGGLTPEEITRQKENEYRPIGEAIAGKYLARAIREADLRIELGKYRGEEEQIVRRALITSLCKSIELGAVESGRRALGGVQLLAGPDSRFEEMRKEFESISGEFEQETLRAHTALEKIERQRLQKLGISGSAIRPKVRETEDWKQEQGSIKREYDLRLDKLRNNLMLIALP